MTEQNRKLKNRVRETCSHGSVRGQDHDGPALLGSAPKVLTGMLLFIAFSVGGFAAEQPPVAVAVKIVEPPRLDGKLDEAFWKDARPLGEFQVLGKDGRRVNDTEARLAYDDTWLYLGVKCTNPLQKLVREPKIKEHDGGVNEDESVELFFDSSGDGKVYYHFLLSCFNVKAEQRFVNGNRERQTWNQPWRSATAINDTGWTAEIAIPLYLFLEQGDFAHIRLNVARNRREPFMDAQKVITHETLETSAWRPVVRSFHEPAAFGALAALGPGKLQMPFLASLERVEIKPYFMKDGVNHYAVELEARGANTQSGNLEVVVTDKPVSGAALVVKQTFKQIGTALSKRTLDVSAPSPSERTVVVELQDAARGETFQTRIVENPPVLKVMDAYLDRNYYTTEKEATAAAEIALPPDSIKAMKVAVEIGGRAIAAAPATGETMVRFPINDVTVGRHPVTIKLLREDGAPFYAIKAELVKRAPNPGMEWKIDQVNRIVLQPDGKPIFPFGPVMGGVGASNEAAFRAIAEAGCNTYFEWGGDGDQRDVLKTAKKFSLYVVSRLCKGSWIAPADADLKLPTQLLTAQEAKSLLSQGGDLKRLWAMLSFYSPSASAAAKAAICAEYFEKTTPKATAYIESVKNHDNLMAWNSIDEPYDDYVYVPKCLNKVYRLTHQVDGYHPIMLLYSSFIPKGDEWVDGATDILCTDPYWIPAMTPEEYGRGAPNFVSKITYWNDQRAAKFRQPVWSVPMAWLWSGTVMSKRCISGPEQHCQNFLAIIHGARGLFWFAYDCINDSGWANLKDSMAMIKVIGPMAVQPKVRQQITHLRASAPEPEYKEAPFIPEKDEYPDVQGRIFRDPADGGLVLIAANSRYYPVTAQVTVEGLSGAVKNIFGGAKLTVREGAFGEKLEPFAVRAWALGAGLKEPVKLTIAALRPELIPPREMALPKNWRPGKKNAFPNPSFEEETLPGNADYYFYDAVVEAEKGVAKFGDKCLKLVKKDQPKKWMQVRWHCNPQQDKETPYVWSFWAKGAKGGERIQLMSPAPRKEFILTPEWKHYESAIVVPARAGGYEGSVIFHIYLCSDGVAWFDGMQLEQGYKATEFEE